MGLRALLRWFTPFASRLNRGADEAPIGARFQLESERLTRAFLAGEDPNPPRRPWWTRDRADVCNGPSTDFRPRPFAIFWRGNSRDGSGE